jgi:hypothetical protein
MHAFSGRPSLDAREIDGMPSSDLQCLLEALTIRVVEVPGEPVHHALCGMQNAQHTRRTAALREVVDHFPTNLDGPGEDPSVE